MQKPRNELLTRSVLRVQKLTYKENTILLYEDEYLMNRRNEQRELHMIRKQNLSTLNRLDNEANTDEHDEIHDTTIER